MQARCGLSESLDAGGRCRCCKTAWRIAHIGKVDYEQRWARSAKARFRTAIPFRHHKSVLAAEVVFADCARSRTTWIMLARRAAAHLAAEFRRHWSLRPHRSSLC